MYQRNHMSHADAMRVIDAIRAEVEATNRGAAVAVVDSHGELMAFLRTDGCKYPSITIAINKAFSAAREQVPSRVIGERSVSEGFPMSNFGDARFTAWGGGVPLRFEGQIVGGVGVSGLPEEEDMILAAQGAGMIG